MSWKRNSLDRLFRPESIAVVGASDKPEKLGSLTLSALNQFSGKVYPVNPRLKRVADRTCYPSVSEIGDTVDLAMIAVGPQQVLSAVRDCADARIGGAIIFTAGFKELGDIGIEHQEQLKGIVDRARIAVIGPNCLGAGNPSIRLNATFFPHPIPLKVGEVAMVSQSGGVTGSMLYQASDRGVGVSKFASVGNRVNIDFHDMLHYLRKDVDTKIICLFVEGTECGREMANEMLLTTEEKPVIVFKVGKTPASCDAALSHTGSLAGNAELYSAAIRQSRGLEVGGVTEMIDTAYCLSVCRGTPQGNRVAVVTHTLGIALVATETLEMNHAVMPLPSEETAMKIKDMLRMPVDIEIKNPIDLLAQGWAQPEIFAEAFRLVLNEDKYDALMIVFAPNYQEDIGGGMPITDIVRTASETTKPIVSVLSSPESKKPPGHEILEEAGIPFFSDPQRAAQALANLLKIHKKFHFEKEKVYR
ncbi:hypothetical protein EU527_07470 [Candidatus Thorarchaeota archaeon]|nr:MAG: hypothetical protein EU527_07470 [Candidatus Thorarchaeota archaeon]